MSKRSIFISYSRKDIEFVKKLITSLRKKGMDVWFDDHIESGNEWDDVLEEQINKAQHMVIVLSETSAASDNVKNEMRFALDKGKRIHPILHKPCSVPLSMSRMHYIDFTTLDYNMAVARLVEDINVAAMKMKANASSKKKPSRWHFKLVAVLAIATMIYGAWDYGLFNTLLDNDNKTSPIIVASDSQDVSQPATLGEANLNKEIQEESATTMINIKDRLDTSLGEEQFWETVSHLNTDDAYEGYLHYLDRFGIDTTYSVLAFDKIVESFDKTGFVVNHNGDTNDEAFGGFAYKDVAENKIMKIDDSIVENDLIFGIKMTSNIYDIISETRNEISIVGQIAQDQLCKVVSIIDTLGVQYLKVNYRSNH